VVRGSALTVAEDSNWSLVTRVVIGRYRCALDWLVPAPVPLGDIGYEPASERVLKSVFVGQARRLPSLGDAILPEFVIHQLPTGAVGLQFYEF